MQRVNVIGKSRQAMADLMRADGVQVVRQTLREVGGGQYPGLADLSHRCSDHAAHERPRVPREGSEVPAVEVDDDRSAE